ncbi:MAG: RDD family protein [Helicobacteraceae bacterium]|jgi:uncharacterized RDD family membrane protein YckC|nr:RDD family protein [Helicobacteraceae bacterium]
MEARFVGIVERLVREQGKDVLINSVKCKAFLSDYSQNEFKKERHLLTIAIEAGAGQAIANAGDLTICKKQQIRFLKEDRFIDETAAAEAIDLLAFVLRGDRSKSIASTQSNSQQSQIAPPYNPPPQYPYNPQGGYQQQSPYFPPPNMPYPPPPQVKYIGFWARVVATIIDNIAITAILFALFVMLYATDFFNSANEYEIEGIINIVGVSVSLIYTICFWVNKQATPGKMLFGAKIVDAKTLGKPSAGQYIGRYFAYILSYIPLGLGFIWVAFDEKKRGWHDMLAGTLVIKRD